jgi:hypothetical protein
MLPILKSARPIDGSENLALPANFQIFFGDAKTVGRFFHNSEPLARDGGFFIAGQQNAKRLFGAAPDAPAQLVKLRQTEAFGVFDNHQRSVRHVNADFDDGRRNQNIRFAARTNFA